MYNVPAPENPAFSLPLFITAVIFSLLAACCPLRIHADELKLKSPAVAYQPKGSAPDTIEIKLTESQIRADLRKLRSIGFRGIVTYGSKGIMGKIPELARLEGLDGTIIMGIWDITSKEEFDHAISQGRFVDGYCLGNEGLGVRYNAEALLSRMRHLRRTTRLPVTTSEPIVQYFQPEYQHVLCKASDWIFPIIHPFWNHPFDPEKAVQWITVHYDYLSAVSGRRIIIKEAGFPSTGHEKLSEEAQVVFFKALARSGLTFFHFEAFDQPWKSHIENNPLIEAHWGIFKADGTPKKIVSYLTELWAE
jgi:exo-beta-1,3-glucanase (GH17 family)